jgi:molybdate transport system permease protein
VSVHRLPRGLAVPAVLGAALLLVPAAALLQRAPWRRIVDDLTSPTARTALRVSLQTSLGALALCLVLGVPLAWVLARATFPGIALLRAAVTLPMVLPPVVGGVALLLAFGRRGVLHLPLSFPTAGATLAEAFVALPFLVLAVEAGLRQLDPRYEEAAATLGAGPWRRFVRVTLPLVGPSVAAGAALAWARALGEFGATITFAGNLPGRTQTLPLAVYAALERDPAAAVSLSLLLLAVSVAVLVGLRSRWSLRP